MFDLHAPFTPTGDQPEAIKHLVAGIQSGRKNQVMLGVTGSGKTFTMANVLRDLNMPALIISHNKTLAGQLYQEMRDFFPHNAVSYFVSYYDYYQPEAYIPQSDTYIEKEAEINELIDKLRLQTTTNIMTRKDVIVVASVSCIYNIGAPSEYGKYILPILTGQPADWKKLATRLIELLYERSEFEFKRGTFRIRGSTMDIYPAYEDEGIHISSKDGIISDISRFETISGKELDTHIPSITVYPAKHYLTNPEIFRRVEKDIRADLAREYKELKDKGRLVEAQRLLQRTNYDLEIIKEVGYVNGIENYSRYLDGRKPGDPPNSLLDFFRYAYHDNFLTFVDESHMTIPQLGGMYNGDHARKKTLTEFGFRLKASFDNRPLKFSEFYKIPPHIIYVSATPDEWEIEQTKHETATKKRAYSGIVEQLIRPTGILDPEIVIRPATNEIPDLVAEIEKRVKNNEKVLVTTLTKKNAEDLTEFVKEKNIRASYLHSDVQTLERSDILDNLRKNQFDVLIGVNLLREGLDLPEVSLVAILDADREGFLRSRTSLIQTMGRAARNIDGIVIMYANTVTRSMQAAIDEINRRRVYQLDYNTKHHIIPKTIYKPVREKIVEHDETITAFDKKMGLVTSATIGNIRKEGLTPYDKKKLIKKLEREMKKQADQMQFEFAIALRDKIRDLTS